MNKVKIKSASQIEAMRRSGRLLADVFKAMETIVKPGVSTMAVNDFVTAYICSELNARPASIGQYGYRYALNASINDVICHGIPSKDDVLGQTDIVNFDVTLEYGGYIADSSQTYIMPEASTAARALVDNAYQAMLCGIRAVKPGARLGDVGFAIQKHAERAGYSVVREYCGHGIGREMHEAPEVLHYGRPATGLALKPGMTFTIEPMINQGSARARTMSDGWTVRTADGGLSAQWEHTILVTQSGFEVLTLREGEVI